MNRDEQAKRLGEQSIGQLLVKFSIPAAFGMVVNATYGIVDSIFIAFVFGRDGLAAVALTVPIMMIMLSAGMMIGIGTNTLLSIRIGQKRTDEAEQLLGTALFLFFLVAILFTTFGLIYIEPLLKAFGASDKTLPFAKNYLSVIICGTIFMQISFGINSFLRGEGKLHIAMVTLLISALLNIFFSWLTLFVFKMGIEGPAYGTVVAQAVSSIWIAWYYLSGRSLLSWRWRYVRFNIQRVQQICLMGLAPCLMNVANCVLMMLANNQLMKYGNAIWSGEDGIAVMRICQSVFLLVFMVVLGLSQGAQPIIGYNTGAKRYDRVARTLSITLLTVFVMTTLYMVMIQIFPHFVLHPFTVKEPQLAVLGEHAVRIFMIMFPGVGIAVITTNYYQATGRGIISLVITMVRQVVILIPLYYFLPAYYGFDGIWYATPISDGIATVISLGLLCYEFPRLRRLIATERQA